MGIRGNLLLVLYKLRQPLKLRPCIVFLGFVGRTGGLDAARQVARDEAAKARACLHVLPSSPQLDALLELSVRSVDRSS